MRRRPTQTRRRRDLSIDGFSFDAVYNGMEARFLRRDDCKTDANGNLTGSWYFTPADGDELYIADSAEAGSYMAATMYARYGYWLTYAPDGSPTGVATYAAGPRHHQYGGLEPRG